MSDISQHARDAADKLRLYTYGGTCHLDCCIAIDHAIDAAQSDNLATIAELREQLANASKQDALLRHLNNETLEERDGIREQLTALNRQRDEMWSACKDYGCLHSKGHEELTARVAELEKSEGVFIARSEETSKAFATRVAELEATQDGFINLRKQETKRADDLAAKLAEVEKELDAWAHSAKILRDEQVRMSEAADVIRIDRDLLQQRAGKLMNATESIKRAIKNFDYNSAFQQCLKALDTYNASQPSPPRTPPPC